VCADPNAGARQQAKIQHKQKIHEYKNNAVKYWNRETRYAKNKQFILGIGESRAQSDIKQSIMRKHGKALSSKEKLQRAYQVEQFVNEGGRSRAAGRNTVLGLLSQKAKLERGVSQAAGRGEAIAQEGLRRGRSKLLQGNQNRMGTLPKFGAPVYMPGKDTGGQIMGAVSTGLSIASLFAGSDIRLKENIEVVGESPQGHTIYEWNYISTPNTRYRGVIAQDVIKINPMAVDVMRNGYLGVYYNKIDVNMEVV
tara:strand:+ start:642 stop:1400 length:759 start_codon:yes stop_codon:yes gene_type:complete